MTKNNTQELARCISQGKRLYGWHISNFVFYREPKELTEFGLKRPPQSWVYVRR